MANWIVFCVRADCGCPMGLSAAGQTITLQSDSASYALSGRVDLEVRSRSVQRLLFCLHSNNFADHQRIIETVVYIVWLQSVSAS